MFYSQFILAKKGPLGTIWIAAHLERKLRKNQVADTDIGVSVDSILFPDMPIALRLSSHLLLGVVRIYSRKVNYLFDDCSDTLLKIKQAFRSTAVDLPPEESTAPYHSITLPETFDLDDFELPDNDLFQGNYVDHHVSTKEQITLQDTMDGVVYSTSQFGLDERFGDGDASQIGLDLSEDLFLEKLANPVDAGIKIQSDADPQTSLQSTTPYEEDEIIEEKNEDAQAMVLDASENKDYAKAPSTPVLVEEPNLFTVQKAQTCNDHLETEDHNSLFIETVDNVGSASSKPVHHGNEYDSKKTVEENELALGGNEIDCLKPNVDLHSVSENVEHLQNEVPSNNEATEDIRGVGPGEKIPSPSSSPASSKENNYHKLCAGVEKIPENEQALLPQKSMNVEFSKNMEESHKPSNVMAPNAPYPLEPVGPGPEMNVEDQVYFIPEDCKTLEDDGEMHSTSFNILKPFNQSKKLLLGGDNSEAPPDFPKYVDEPRLHETFEVEADVHAFGLSAEMQGEECRPTTANEPFLEANVISEPNLSDVEADRSYLDAVLKEALEFPNGIAVSELSAPEKLLSMPEGSSHLLNELLVDSTPDRVVQEESEGHGAAINIVSGRKRTFTESTLTTQSLDSDESFAKRQSKTAKFIPDDDDLLSSILVGRKSSILKLKPTPNPSEAMPLKRCRTTPRVSSSKRKVLMDDSMVLHGDTIRQQLMGTEDIRRVRKKAPSTRHEIWIVQKQLLEDEVFSEPIATGMSIELIDLHKQTHDLRNIVISIDENIDSLDSATDTARPSVIKENEIEGSTETPVARIETGPQSSKILVHIENQQREDNDIGSHENDTQLHMTSADIELKTSNHEHEKNSEIEIYGNSVEVVNAAKSTLILEQSLEFPSLDSPLNLCNERGVDTFNFGEIHKDIILEFETEYGAPGEGLPNGAEDGDILELRGDSCAGPSRTIDNMELSITNMSPEIGECHDLVVANDNPPMEEIEKEEPEFMKEQEFTAVDLGCDEKNAASNLLPDEPKADSLYFIEASVKDTSLESEEIASFNHFKSPSCLEAEAHGIMVLEETGHGHHVIEDHGDMEETIIEHDTDFLNFDDDDQAEDDDDNYVPSAEETRFLENSGWSSRSRAVANYLKTLFDKEAEIGKNVIPMENLLSGKTRKEASRMFFETLVLKTRDYIHVEQQNPYDNINIKSRGKLMKSDF